MNGELAIHRQQKEDCRHVSSPSEALQTHRELEKRILFSCLGLRLRMLSSLSAQCPLFDHFPPAENTNQVFALPSK